MRRIAIVTGLSCWFLAPAALAAPPSDLESVSSPRQAYERGTKAWDASDEEAAAYWFARADALEHSDSALGAALRAARAADLPALCMVLVARAERAQSGGELGELARKTRSEYAARTGRIVTRCTGVEPCSAKIDGQPPLEGGFVSLGAHVVSWTCGAEAKQTSVSVSADAETRVDLSCAEVPAQAPTPTPVTPPPAKAAPPPARAGAPARRHGLSPTWVWIGAGTTLALGAVTTWSGLDTRSKHQDFVDGGRVDTSLRDDGKSAQTRTNVLVAATAVSAVVTAGLALFAVDFSPRAEVGLAARSDGVEARLGGRF